MTRLDQRGIPLDAAGALVLDACRRSGSPDAADVVGLLTVALALALAETAASPDQAVNTARLAGPEIVRLVQQVQAGRLAGAKPEGSA